MVARPQAAEMASWWIGTSWVSSPEGCVQPGLHAQMLRQGAFLRPRWPSSQLSFLL